MRAIPPGMAAVAMLLGLTAHAAAQGAPVVRWMRGGHSSYMTQLVHSSDGVFFASAGSDRTVKIWRSSDGLLLRTFTIPFGTRAIALSPDNATICAGGASAPGPLVRCWHVADGSQLWSVTVPGALGSDTVDKLAFSPDGLRLASAVGVRLPIFDASNGSFITDFRGTGPGTFFYGGLSYSPDGSLLAVNTTGDRLATINSLTGALVWDSGVPSSFGYDVAFSPDGQYVSSVNGLGLQVFRNSDHVKLPFHTGSPAVIVGYAPNGGRIATGYFGNLNLFNTSTGTLIRQWVAHGNPGVDFTPLTFTADSTKLISGLLDLKRWKASDGTFDALLTVQAAPVYLIAMSRDESVVAAYSNNLNTGQHVIGLYRSADGSLVRYIDVGIEALRGLALSPDGKHLAAADNTQMRVWNVGTGALERSRAEAGGGSFWRPLAYTPDGTAIAQGGDGASMSVRLWNPTTDTQTLVVAGPATALRFLPSPDGRLVVARQIDPTGTPSMVNIVTLAGHVDRSLFGLARITSVDVSPDGQSIVAAGVDGAFTPFYVARIWRVSDGAALQTLVGHTDTVKGVAFSWDSQTVITGSRDSTVRIWKVSDGSQLRLYDDETYTSTTITEPGVVSALASTRSGAFMYGRGDATVVLAVNPEAQPKVMTLKVPVIATAGCKPTSAKVTLDRPAPPVGLVLSLASSSPTATVPASISFKGGTTTKSFKITTSPVAALDSATIGVTLDGQTTESDLGLRPIGIKTLTLSPTSVIGGGTSTGTVVLECAAVPGDIVVNLSSSMPAVAQPAVAAITIPQGTTNGVFTVSTTPVTAVKKPSIRATTVPGALAKSKTLPVNP